jgi:hypothetical protein
MSKELEPLKEILSNFLSQMKKKEEIWKALGKNIAGTPGFGDEDIDPWPRKEAYCWIFADLYDHFSKFDRTAPVVDAMDELALPHYKGWWSLNRDVQIYPQLIVQPPTKEETLKAYLERISKEIYENRYCKSVKWRSLRSLVSYLREEVYPLDERGCIDEVFPEEMRLLNGKIAKENPHTAYPIDIYATAEILKSLALEVLDGRPNAQFCAAEALGLSMICLTAARRRLPTQLKLLSQIPINCLMPSEPLNSPDKLNRSLLLFSTLYGTTSMPISLTMAKYLNAIKSILPADRTTLFQSSSRSLRRTLDNVVKQIPSVTNLGKITFLTFLNHPHEAIGQR